MKYLIIIIIVLTTICLLLTYQLYFSKDVKKDLSHCNQQAIDNTGMKSVPILITYVSHCMIGKGYEFSGKCSSLQNSTDCFR